MSLSDERIAEIIRTAKYVPKKEAIRMARELQSLRASQAKVVEALQRIARQVSPEDMSVDQQLDADFEGACEIMIKLARAALAAHPGGQT